MVRAEYFGGGWLWVVSEGIEFGFVLADHFEAFVDGVALGFDDALFLPVVTAGADGLLIGVFGFLQLVFPVDYLFFQECLAVGAVAA